MNKLYSNIAKVNYGEEIVFQQILITDNLEREDIFIIDREVTETSLRRKRIDLLALKQIKDNQYHFLVIVLKLGKNPKLKKDVGGQLQEYVNHVKSNFNNWKSCYEKNYEQIKKTGIFDKPLFKSVKIINGTKGLVIVGGYSGIGKKNIKELEKSYPDIEVKQFSNRL